MRVLFNLFLVFILIPAQAHAQTTLPQDDSSAVILAYHRIGEDAHPQSSLRTETFRTHINEILRGDYNVMPLPDIIEAIKTNAPLPNRTIAITFEGTPKSATQHAFPLLQEHNLPFTVFLNNKTDWPSVIDITAPNTTFGITLTTQGQTQAKQRRQINIARAAFRKNIGREAQFFAHPHGAISDTLKTIVKEQGFTAAFGLHSGVAHAGADLTALPRFTMTDRYGDIDRFRLVTNALPLPVTELSMEPPIGFTLPEALSADRLTCFVSGQDKPNIETLGHRIEIRPQDPLEGRTRINCTLPAPKAQDESPRWRWLGMLLNE